MADFEVTIGADASQLMSQMQQASDSAKDLASALNSSAESVVGSGAKIDSAFEGIGAAAQAAASSLTPSTAAFDAVGSSIGGMLEQLTGVGAEIGALGSTFAVLAPAALASAEATAILGSSFAAASEGVDSLLGPLLAIGEAESLAGISAAQMELGFVGAAAGAEQLLVNLGATGESLAEIAAVATETEDVIGGLGTSFNLSDESINQMSASLEGMLTGLSAVGGEVATTVEQLSLFSTTVDAANASSNQFDAALSALQAIVPETAALFDSLMTSTRGAGEAAAQTAEQYSLLAAFDASGAGVKTVDTSGTTAALSAATSQLTAAEAELNGVVTNANASWYEYAAAEQRASEAASEVGSAQFVLISQITELQERLNAATAEKVALNSSLASSAGEVIEAEQYELELMEQLAEAQAALASSSTSGVGISSEGITEAAAAEQGLADASVVASNALTELVAKLGEAGVLSNNVAGAISYLSNATAAGNTTSTQYAIALGLANNAAQKLGVTLVNTASGLQIVATGSRGAAAGQNTLTTSANNAAESLTRENVALASAGARLGAASIGAGQFGYALASLSRVFGPLNTIFSTLFPIFIITAAIEVVSNLVDKFRNLEQAIRKAQVEFDDLGTASLRAADDLEVENLKIEDQIAKLEGRPTSNRLQEAIVESEREVDKLTDAFERALEKYQELMKAGEVDWWKNLVTGAEKTTGFEEAASKQIDILKVRVAAQNEATAALNLAKAREADATSDASRLQASYDAADAQRAKDVADQKVAAEQSATLRILEEEQKRTQVKKQAALDQIDVNLKAQTQTTPSVAGQPSVTPTASYIKAAIADAEVLRSQVEQNYSYIQTQEAEGIAELKNRQLQEETLNKVIENRSKLASAGDAAEGRKRDYTEEEAAIKAKEALIKESAAIELKAVEDVNKAEDAKAKNIAAHQVETGTQKAASSIEAIDLEIAAEKRLTQAKLEEEVKRYQAGKDTLVTNRGIIEKDEVGPEKTKALAANNTQLVELITSTNARIQSLTSEGNTALLNLDTEAAKARTELAKKSAQDVITASREATRAAIDDAKEAASERITYAKAAAEEETRSKLSTTTGASGESRVRITGIEEERAAIEAAYNDEKSALASRQAAIQSEIATTQASLAPTQQKSEVIAALSKQYFELAEAIKKVNAEEINFDTSSTKAQVDEITQSWRDQTAAINNFVTSATSDLNSFVTTIATTNVNIQQVWSKMVFSMEKQFIEMILHLIEQTTAFQAISSTIEGAFRKIFEAVHLIPKPPVTLPAGGGLPGGAGGIVPEVGGIGGSVPYVGAEGAPTAIPGVTGVIGAAPGLPTLPPLTPSLPSLAAGATSTSVTEGAFTTAIGSNTLALQANTSALLGRSTTAVAGVVPTAPGIVSASTSASAPGGAISSAAAPAQQAAEQLNITNLNASTAALTQFQVGLHMAAPAIAAHTTATASNTGITVANTGATAADTGATGTSTVSTVTSTAAQTAHTATIFTSIGAFAAHTAVMFENIAAMLIHTIAVIADKIALIVHAAVALFTGGAATGGLIEGPGTGTSDSIPLRVSHGEFIVKAQSVAKPGMLELLHGINKGHISPAHPGGTVGRGFAEGGLVSEDPSRGTALHSVISSDSLSVSERSSSSAVNREMSSLSSSVDQSLSSTAASVFNPAVNPETSGGIGSTATPASALASSVSTGDRGVADSLRGQFDQLSSTLSSTTSSSNLALGVLKKSLGAMIAGIPAQDRSLTTNIKNQFEQVSGALNNTATSGNTALGTLNKSLGAMVVNANPSDNRQLLSGINSRLANATSLTPSQNLASRLSYTAPGGLNSTTAIANNTSTTNQGDSSSSNFHFNFNPTVHGNFDVNKHGEELFRFMQGKLRRMGGGRKI